MANEFDPTEPVGHKWTLTALWKYLASEVRKLKLKVTAIFSKLCLGEVTRSPERVASDRGGKMTSLIFFS